MTGVLPGSGPPVNPVPPFRDPGLPPRDRARALLASLTLSEKVAMLHQYAPGIDRLGVAPFRTGQEILHGASWLTGVTSFPQAVGLGATWDPALLEAVGAAVAAEVRQKHECDPTVSLNVWGPVVNLLRDPRWGRNEEGYSEDPLLTGELATGYCRGLCDGGAREMSGALLTAPTLKHFLAYNHETDKDGTAATGMRPRVLREYDIRPFEMVVRAGVAVGVMLAYTAINGRPGHLSPYTSILRSHQPDLVVVGDAHGTAGLVDPLGYFDQYPTAYAAAMRGGLDSFTNDSDDPTPTVKHLRAAVTAGLLTEERIDESVYRLLLMRVRLGEFGRAVPVSPSHAIPPPEPLAVGEAPRALAREAARKAIVLLKNRAGVLPIVPETSPRIALIGPHADLNLDDWVSGTPMYRTTVRAALTARLPEEQVDFVEGVDRVAFRCLSDGRYLRAGLNAQGAPLHLGTGGEHVIAHFDVFDWGGGTVALRAAANSRFVSRLEDGTLVNRAEIPGGWLVPEALCPEVDKDGSWRLRHMYSRTYLSVADGRVLAISSQVRDAALFVPEVLGSAVDAASRAARAADIAVVVVGTHPLINGREGHDQLESELPSGQEAVARAALAANPRTVVVITSGNPNAIPWLAEHAPALIWSAHGGQEHGAALADVLLGDYAPSGRLPQTWYPGVADLGDILDYDIIGSAKTYLYFRGQPLFPFGHGLTYATFRYGTPRVSATVLSDRDGLRVTVDVTNTGTVDSDEVVQLYVRVPCLAAVRPRRQLCGFRRLHVRVGETCTVDFDVRIADLAYWDVSRQRFAVEPGRYRFLVGRSLTDIVGDAEVSVIGDGIGPRSLSQGLVRAVDFDDHFRMRIVDEERGAGEAMLADAAGAWLAYRDVDLGAVGCVVMQVAARDGARIRVLLDDPVSGVVASAVQVPPGGGNWASQTTQAEFAGHGRRDVFVVFDAPAKLAAFGLTASPCGGSAVTAGI